jgi:hypothetical protein
MELVGVVYVQINVYSIPQMMEHLLIVQKSYLVLYC